MLKCCFYSVAVQREVRRVSKPSVLRRCPAVRTALSTRRAAMSLVQCTAARGRAWQYTQEEVRGEIWALGLSPVGGDGNIDLLLPLTVIPCLTWWVMVTLQCSDCSKGDNTEGTCSVLVIVHFWKRENWVPVPFSWTASVVCIGSKMNFR